MSRSNTRSETAIRVIEEFLVEFNRLVELGRWLTLVGLGGRPSLSPREGQEDAFAQQYAIVAQKAGPAAIAVQKAGVLWAYKPPGTMQTQPMCLVAVWSLLTRDNPPFTAADLITACHTAIGAWSPDADLIANGPPPSAREKLWRRTWNGLSTPWKAVTGAFTVGLSAAAGAVATHAVDRWFK